MIYEKQITGIEENIEAKDVEIYELLKSGVNLEAEQRENIASSLQQVEESKNDLVMELEK